MQSSATIMIEDIVIPKIEDTVIPKIEDTVIPKIEEIKDEEISDREKLKIEFERIRAGMQK